MHQAIADPLSGYSSVLVADHAVSLHPACPQLSMHQPNTISLSAYISVLVADYPSQL
jgi:hypothetical protein